MLNIKFHPIHSELASNWRQRGRTRLVWMTDVNSASKNRVKIVVVETESAPSRHNVAKNPERIRIFSRIKRREFSSKKKNSTRIPVRCSIKFDRRRQIRTNLQSVTRYYSNVNSLSLEILSMWTIGTSYLQPLGSTTLKLLACYSFVAIMQLFGHSRQFS